MLPEKLHEMHNSVIVNYPLRPWMHSCVCVKTLFIYCHKTPTPLSMISSLLQKCIRRRKRKNKKTNV